MVDGIALKRYGRKSYNQLLGMGIIVSTYRGDAFLW